MEKQVLIVSTSHDEESISPVRQKLTSRGYEVVTYQTDKVLNGLSHFSLDLSTDGYIDIQYKDKSIAPNDIVVAMNFCQRMSVKNVYHF